MRTCCMNVSDPFNGLAAVLGIAAPQTFQDARELLTLAGVAQQPDRPERAWLSAAGLEAAGHAARVLHDAWQAAIRAEADASAYFTPAVLGEDAEGLAARFGTDHHRLGKLSGDYRADKKTVASFTREGVARDDAHRHLQLAVAWKQAADALWAAERAHAAILGAYYTGRPTDWNRLSGALACAAAVVRAARGQDLSRAAGLIGRDAVRDPAIARVADDTVRDLKTWHAVLATGRAAAPPGTAARHDRRRDRLAARAPGAVALCCRLHLRGQPGCRPSAHRPPGPPPGRVAGSGRCRTRTPGRTRCPVQRRFR